MRITPEICEGCYSHSEYGRGWPQGYGRTDTGEPCIEGCALLGMKFIRSHFALQDVPEHCDRIDAQWAAGQLREL